MDEAAEMEAAHAAQGIQEQDQQAQWIGELQAALGREQTSNESQRAQIEELGLALESERTRCAFWCARAATVGRELRSDHDVLKRLSDAQREFGRLSFNPDSMPGNAKYSGIFMDIVRAARKCIGEPCEPMSEDEVATAMNAEFVRLALEDRS